ncbi:MAG: type II secretion system protein GspK [Hyphomicrobiaceae bacterium]|nr:type II secretion system protein GspK [Hyphomicrobiaceae bacterium]
MSQDCRRPHHASSSIAARAKALGDGPVAAASNPAHATGAAGLRSARGEAGFALVLVLWLIVVLSLQIAALNASVRDSVRLVDNAIASIRGETLRHAGLEWAVAHLLAADERQRWQADGSQRLLELDGAEVTATITDENGRININLADPVLLEGILLVTTRSRRDAETLSRRLVDWRSGSRRDAAAPTSFAESRASASTPAMGSAAGTSEPPSRPFLDTADLVRVPGFSEALVQRLRPFLTTATTSGRINPRSAPEEVLRALPGLTGDAIARLLEARKSPRTSAEELAALLAPARTHLGTTRGPAYRIRLEARSGRLRALGRTEAVIVLGQNAAAPYAIISWRDQLTAP